jgi:hypothetical protein
MLRLAQTALGARGSGMQRRLDKMPQSGIVRRRTVEHTFGTLKSWMGATHFRTKTLPRVRTEMSLPLPRDLRSGLNDALSAVTTHVILRNGGRRTQSNCRLPFRYTRFRHFIGTPCSFAVSAPAFFCVPPCCWAPRERTPPPKWQMPPSGARRSCSLSRPMGSA